MITPETKLYVQLRPDDISREHIMDIQASLSAANSSARLVTDAALHLTVLHIGQVQRMIASMRPYTTMQTEQIMDHVAILAEGLREVAGGHVDTISLQPKGYEWLGHHDTTYVLLLASTPALRALHQASLQVLQDFFAQCGIRDVRSFMQQDANFQHALNILPHVTIAKNYTGKSSNVTPHAMTFSVMPIVY